MKQKIIFSSTLLILLFTATYSQNIKHITNETNLKINYLSLEVKKEIQDERNAKIKNLIGGVKSKGEYEKESTYSERLQNKKSIYENQFPIDFYERKYLNSIITSFINQYDSENQVLMFRFNSNKPFLIKLPNNKASKFISEIRNYQFKNLEVNIIDEETIELKNGTIRDVFNETYTINNQLPFNLISTNNSSLKILERVKNIEIIPVLNYYQNVDNNELFISKNDSYLTHYIEKYQEEISINKKSILRNKNEYENIRDYEKAISLDQINTSFDNTLLYSIFNKNNPNFNFMQYDNQSYNAEDEIFKITYNGYGSIYIPVPIADAQNFGSLLKGKNLKVNPQFLFLDKNTIALKSLEFRNSKYSYNSMELISYNNSSYKLLSNSIKKPVDIKKVIQDREKFLQAKKLEEIERKKIKEEHKEIITEKRKLENEETQIIIEKRNIAEAQIRIKNEKKTLALERKYVNYIGKYAGELRGIKFKYFITIKDSKLYRKDDKGSKPSYLIRPSSMGKLKENVYYLENNLTKTHSIKFDLKKNRLIEKIERKTIKLEKIGNEEGRIDRDELKIVEEQRIIENKKKKLEEEEIENKRKKINIEDKLTKSKAIIKSKGISVAKLEEEIIRDVPFAIIEDVPVYPGCKGNKAKLRACLQEKITQHVNRKFNADLASDLGLSAGVKRIFLMFKIDKNGYIVDAMARGPHKRLEEEAIRVIKLLPKMKPGKQRGRPVGVKYSLPIAFKVE